MNAERSRGPLQAISFAGMNAERSKRRTKGLPTAGMNARRSAVHRGRSNESEAAGDDDAGRPAGRTRRPGRAARTRRRRNLRGSAQLRLRTGFVFIAVVLSFFGARLVLSLIHI